MPVTLSLVPRTSRDEIKRNLILRLRYGPLAQSNRCSVSSGNLCVEGQAVSKLRDRVAFHLPGGEFGGLFTSPDESPSISDSQCFLASQNSPSLNQHMDVKGVGYPKSKTSACDRIKPKSLMIDVIDENEEYGEGGINCCFEPIIVPHTSKVTSATACAGDVGDCWQKATSNQKSSTSAGDLAGNSKQPGSVPKPSNHSFEASESLTKATAETTDAKEAKPVTKHPKRKSRRGLTSRKFNVLHVSPNSSGRAISGKGNKRKNFKSESSKKHLENTSDMKALEHSSSIDDLQEIVHPFIKKFHDMPESKPKNVCFDYPGIDLTHVDVKEAIEKVIPGAFEKNKVVSMQFENVNIKYGTCNMNNRWHVELIDFATRNKLIKAGLDLRPKSKTRDNENSNQKNPFRSYSCNAPRKSKVDVKLYDSVVMEEYKTYLKRTAAEEKLQKVILMCAGRGHHLLSSMI